MKKVEAFFLRDNSTKNHNDIICTAIADATSEMNSTKGNRNYLLITARGACYEDEISKRSAAKTDNLKVPHNIGNSKAALNHG